MKSRIIGYILVILVVGALYVLTESSNTQSTPAQPTFKTGNDDAFKGLSINN